MDRIACALTPIFLEVFENQRPLTAAWPMSKAEEYLAAYLARISDANCDIYGELAEWQYLEFKADRQAAALAELNASLGFAQGSYFHLQPGHLPTTAVGRLDGLVIVSANPGYRETANALEHKARIDSPEHNQMFCRHIFEAYPQKLNRTVRYWTYALRMWAMEFARKHQTLNSRQLWARAQEEEWEIGGVDLIPFHSSRDGITPLLFKPEGGRLKTIAKETLAMVCRLPQSINPRRRLGRRVVLVSSKAGARLVCELRREGALDIEKRHFGPPAWKMQLLRASNGTAVMSLPYQVFSRASPPDYTRPRLAELIGQATRGA